MPSSSYEDQDSDNAQYKANFHAIGEAIHKKSLSVFHYGLLSLISYVIGAFWPDWVRWFTSFFIYCLISALLGMFGAITQRQEILPTFVYRTHMKMLAVSVIMLAYALVGLWLHLPVPWLALIAGILLGVALGMFASPRRVH